MIPSYSIVWFLISLCPRRCYVVKERSWLSLSLSFFSSVYNKQNCACHSLRKRQTESVPRDRWSNGWLISEYTEYRDFITICDLFAKLLYAEQNNFLESMTMWIQVIRLSTCFPFSLSWNFLALFWAKEDINMEWNRLVRKPPGQVRDGATVNILLLHNSLSWQHSGFNVLIWMLNEDQARSYIRTDLEVMFLECSAH